MSPSLGGNAQKLDTVVDINFSNYLGSTSIFSKVISHKLSNGASGDLYSRCRMNFVNDPVQTQAPQFMNMGLPSINTLNKSGVLGTPTTIIRRLMDGYHWSASDNILGKATAVGMSAAKSDHNFNYKPDF